MRHTLVAAFLLATWASAVLVAQYRYLPDSPGTWKPWKFIAYPDDRRMLGARPADVKELEAQLLALNAIIKKTVGFTNPIGFSVETAGALEPEAAPSSSGAGEPALTVRPLPAWLNFGAYPVMEFGSGAAAKRDDTGETAQLLFFVNQLSQPLFASSGSRVPEFEQLDVDVARLAAPQPDVLGFSRYGETLVIKKNAAPIWTSVTFAETLELVARGIDRRLVDERGAAARLQAAYDEMKDPKKREERLAQYRKIAPLQKDPAFMEKMTKAEAAKDTQADTLLPQIASAKAVVSKSEQDLADVRTTAAGLSAADKAAPACYASREPVSLARFRRAPASGCDPLVRPNWKLFNPALPRSAPQVLTITHFEPCLIPDRAVLHVGGCTANARLLESIDKAALLAWLQ
ncbi:MAG: hypothetical protein IT184_03880 [Acidobacteria bacterium]|nr:hypothetical protein [Acidobacteriota bacterium]